MLDRARAHGGEVEYRVADATSEEELLSLSEAGSFDAAVCNMAMMDMIDLDPMVRALARLLRVGGRFVFSTVHPAFNGGGATRTIEQFEDEEGIHRVHSVKVSSYITPRVGKGVAIEGQPVTQWYFDRPINQLFGVCFGQGFVLDGMEEPVLSPEDARLGSTTAVFLEVPPVLVARMRLR